MSSVRLLVWADVIPQAYRLAERAVEGWTLSEHLSADEFCAAVADLAARRRPAFVGSNLVAGLIGAEDVTDYAAHLNAKLLERRRQVVEKKRRGRTASSRSLLTILR